MSIGFVARTNCPGCGGDAATTLYRSRFADEPIAGFIRSYYRIDPTRFAAAVYQVDRCDACTLVYQHWIGDDATLNALYGEWIDQSASPDSEPNYHADIAAPRLSRDGHEVMAVAAQLRTPLDRLVVLDYGMGWAGWARAAAALGADAYGLDLSPSRVAFAQANGIPTLTDDELSEGRYDFINTDQVFEHVPDPLGLARRLAAALKPGGILKFSVPAGDRVMADIERLRSGASVGRDDIMSIQPLEHINCFTRQSVAVLADRAGLAIATPNLATRYTFLRHRGAVLGRGPAKTLKELVRPLYTFTNANNLYRWLRKPA